MRGNYLYLPPPRGTTSTTTTCIFTCRGGCGYLTKLPSFSSSSMYSSLLITELFCWYETNWSTYCKYLRYFVRTLSIKLIYCAAIVCVLACFRLCMCDCLFAYVHVRLGKGSLCRSYAGRRFDISTLVCAPEMSNWLRHSRLFHQMLFYPSIHPSIRQSVGRSVGQRVSELVSQSVSQSVSQLLIDWLIDSVN